MSRSLSSYLIGLGVAVVVLAASHWVTYQAGNRSGSNAALVAKLQASAEALAKRVTENIFLAQQQAQAAQKATLDHEKELEAIRTAARTTAAQRVPVSAGFCRSLAGAPESAPSGSDGQVSSGAAYLPEPFASNLRQLAAEADGTLADLRHLVRRVEAARCFE